MKRFIISSILSLSVFSLSAQTNTFPTSGNVGIGNLSPTTPLEVYNNSGVTFRLGKSTGEAYFTLGGASTDFASINNIYGGGLAISTGNGSLAEQFRITTTGNVGIGTNAPYYKLEVITGNKSGQRLVTSASTVAYPQVDLYDQTTGAETVISSTDGTTVGTFLASYSNTPLLFGAHAGSSPTAKMAILPNGNVLIGKSTQTNAGYKLDINGKARINEIVVNTTGADFVFAKTYKLRPLAEVEKHILTNGHLPDILPGTIMQREGVAIGELQTKLLQKVEELTLYIIAQDKKIQAQEERLKLLEKKRRHSTNNIKKSSI